MMKPLKTRLLDAGYTLERVYKDNQYKGMKVKKDGVQAHTTPYISCEVAEELLRTGSNYQ